MIVPMSKVFIAAAAPEKDSLLHALRDLGVLHLTPVDPEKASPDEPVAVALEAAKRAEQILSTTEPTGEKPDMTAKQAVADVLTIHRRSVESDNRLSAIHRKLEDIAPWGETTLQQLAEIREAGLNLTFALMPAADVKDIKAECITVKHFPNRTAGVAVVDRTGKMELPESAEIIEEPAADAPTLRAQAKEVDESLAADAKKLAQLAHMLEEVKAYRLKKQAQAEYAVADRGGLDDPHLYAIQGWVPEERVSTLAAELSERGVHAAVQALEPTEDDEPPTLIRYPKWVEPIKALFAILGTVPGYRELDLSWVFMLAMPIFTAMLVGDAGYGLVFVLCGWLFRGKLRQLTGNNDASNLTLIFGFATIAWGMLTANYFGVGPGDVSGWAKTAMLAVAPLYRENADDGRNVIIGVSMVLAVLHLVTAHVQKMLAIYPSQQWLAELGWCGVLVAMFNVVWTMFIETPVYPMPLTFVLLGVGGALVVGFSLPHKNPVKRVGLGILSNLMPVISSFGDTISYIRLMAVGLASYYIASAFNSLAGDIFSAGWWGFIPGVPVLILAHGMNIALCLIAIFAHAVRLNMLELSNNAGVQWAGSAYRPFREISADT